MRGEFKKNDECQRNSKKKRILYTDEEKQEICEEARSFFLCCDQDLVTLKQKAAKYGRELLAVPIDGDCLLHAFRKQCDVNPMWTLMDNRGLLAYYLAKMPEQFILYANPYILNQSYESYILNFFYGYSYGDELIAAVWGHIWNLRVTMISPHTLDLKCFHKEEDFPDVVIVHNGRPGLDGHFFATSKYFMVFYVISSQCFASFTAFTSYYIVFLIHHCKMYLLINIVNIVNDAKH